MGTVAQREKVKEIILIVHARNGIRKDIQSLRAEARTSEVCSSHMFENTQCLKRSVAEIRSQVRALEQDARNLDAEIVASRHRTGVLRKEATTKRKSVKGLAEDNAARELRISDLRGEFHKEWPGVTLASVIV